MLIILIIELKLLQPLPSLPRQSLPCGHGTKGWRQSLPCGHGTKGWRQWRHHYHFCPYPVGMGPKGGDSGGIITTFVPTLWAWDQRAFDCKSKGDNGWRQE